MQLNDYLPSYTVEEKHSIIIHASPETVFTALCNIDIGASSVIKTLVNIRQMYNRLTQPQRLIKIGTFAEFITTAGFIPLGEIANQEIAWGFIGKFWQPSASFMRDLTARDFLNFQQPGYCKGVWNFSITNNADATVTLSTQTRVLCLGWQVKLLFLPYWAIVRPFSGWIRRELLRMIKQQVELIRK